MAKSRSIDSDAGFSLVEVMVATLLLTTAVISLAQLFGLSTQSNVSARTTTHATMLAEQKLEELRALTWGFDPTGLPVSDMTTNTAIAETEEGTVDGTGLTPSPPGALKENTPGFVDYIDKSGKKVGTGGNSAPGSAVYTRRWSIEPLPTNPNNTLIIQVLVTGKRDRATTANDTAVVRRPDEARLVTVKTRKAQ